MRVWITKVSDRRHRVRVVRADGSEEAVDLDSRSFLRHDLAHFVVESELGLAGGVWGAVAAGGSFSGDGLDGADMTLAESLAGPMQTLLRTDADVDTIHEVLTRIAPDVVTRSVAVGLHERMRRCLGHWAATPYGGVMELAWDDRPTPS